MNIKYSNKDCEVKKFLECSSLKGEPCARLTREVFIKVIEKLQEINDPEHFFELEDRIIDEITFAMLKMPPEQARYELMRIKDLILNYSPSTKYAETFLKSLRNSIKGAVSAALKCL